MFRGKVSYLYLVSSFNGHYPLTEYWEETDSYCVTTCGMGMLVTSVECRFGPVCWSVQFEMLVSRLDSLGGQVDCSQLELECTEPSMALLSP